MDFAVQPISFNDLNSTSDSTGRYASALNHHKSTSSTTATQATDTVQSAHDTVKLSVNSQIQALKQRGASVVEIATKLGLSITDVDQMLHISAAVTAAQVATSAAQASASAALGVR
jgi:hypothetical protein